MPCHIIRNPKPSYKNDNETDHCPFDAFWKRPTASAAIPRPAPHRSIASQAIVIVLAGCKRSPHKLIGAKLLVEMRRLETSVVRIVIVFGHLPISVPLKYNFPIMVKKLSSVWAAMVLTLICAASFGLMLFAAHTDSAIVDEEAHIPSGYAYVQQLDYRLNPEHPPLIKALAELPVLLFVRPTFPTSLSAWTQGVNAEWAMGAAFLYHSGNDAQAIIFASRIMPILITILTVILVYFLARRIMGPLWALVPSFMFAFDPAVLANGHYVTTDIGAAFGMVLSFLFFLRFIDDPSRKNLWYAGIAFGVGQLTKFSTPILVPMFLFLAFVLWLRDIVPSWRTRERRSRMRMLLRRFGRRVGRTFFIFLIGYALIVYPVYALFSVGEPMTMQTSATVQILRTVITNPAPAGAPCHVMQCIADLDIAMTKNVVTRPIAQYLLGILMVLQRVNGGNTIYFLGAVRYDGGWIYFPVLFLLKEPLPTLIIVLAGLFLALAWTLRAMRARARAAGASGNRIGALRARLRAWRAQCGDYLTDHFTEFSFASFIAIYGGLSMHSPLDIGIRYLLPLFPFIFILAAGVWRRWIMRLDLATARAAVRSVGAAAAKYALLIALLAWLLLETFFAAPYFLSYYNELGGGVAGGYHFADDSNYDWGQDLLRLKSFVAAHPEIHTIAVDYFGGGDPAYTLGSKEVNWWPARGNPAAAGIHWLAISVNILELDTQPLAPGMTRSASSSYAWLAALRPPQDATGTWLGGTMGNLPTPDYRVGTSIFVYHL